MIRKANDKKVVVNEQMRGGTGSVIIEHIIDKDELYDKGRLFARIIIKQNCSIGYHTHEGEMETFYILKGTASYNDNGVQKQFSVLLNLHRRTVIMASNGNCFICGKTAGKTAIKNHILKEHNSDRGKVSYPGYEQQWTN